jgi:hypothetical protein
VQIPQILATASATSRQQQQPAQGNQASPALRLLGALYSREVLALMYSGSTQAMLQQLYQRYSCLDGAQLHASIRSAGSWSGQVQVSWHTCMARGSSADAQGCPAAVANSCATAVLCCQRVMKLLAAGSVVQSHHHL